jgi:hypothetical protein
VLDHLKAEAEAFAKESKEELRGGMLTPPPVQEGKAGVLRRLLDGSCYASGIIDPACVGPVCAAEGVSPAPREEWPVLSLAAPAL